MVLEVATRASSSFTMVTAISDSVSAVADVGSLSSRLRPLVPPVAVHRNDAKFVDAEPASAQVLSEAASASSTKSSASSSGSGLRPRPCHDNDDRPDQSESRCSGSDFESDGGGFEAFGSVAPSS